MPSNKKKKSTKGTKSKKKGAKKQDASLVKMTARPGLRKKSTKKKPTKKRASVRTTAGTRKGKIVRKTNVQQGTRKWSSAPAEIESGDLQGLSRTEEADSESVEELVEEGNAFEAEAVAGVEEGDTTREVHTHEVPEDDVPEEYLDKD